MQSSALRLLRSGAVGAEPRQLAPARPGQSRPRETRLYGQSESRGGCYPLGLGAWEARKLEVQQPHPRLSHDSCRAGFYLAEELVALDEREIILASALSSIQTVPVI